MTQKSAGWWRVNSRVIFPFLNPQKQKCHATKGGFQSKSSPPKLVIGSETHWPNPRSAPGWTCPDQSSQCNAICNKDKRSNSTLFSPLWGWSFFLRLLKENRSDSIAVSPIWDWGDEKPGWQIWFSTFPFIKRKWPHVHTNDSFSPCGCQEHCTYKKHTGQIHCQSLIEAEVAALVFSFILCAQLGLW